MGEIQANIEKKTEAWNVAQGYTQLLILKTLIDINKLVTMSLYGTENIEDSIMIPEQVKNNIRIESIYRLIDKEREIIENSFFAMKKTTREPMEKLQKRIIEVQQLIIAISSVKNDSRTGENKIVINEKHFSNSIEELRKIKTELPHLLNQSNLIFPSTEEIDIEELSKRLEFGG